MDDNASLAAQAIAAGPQTVAPASFDGHGWLVVLNMWAMTFATFAAIMVFGLIIRLAWTSRTTDRGWAPARVWRILGLLVSTGIGLRCGVEAVTLWGWNPLQPEQTAGYLLAKRLIDPIAVTSGVCALTLFVLSMPGMLEQLRKEPMPLRMWQAWPMIRRLMGIAGLMFVAALAVVSFR